MKKKISFAELKNNEKIARRGVIVEAAQRVFAVKPFNKVSIRDIAKEAGISHASIYRYFPDQQSLFVEAFLHGAEEITAILDEIIKSSRRKPIEKVAEAYLTYLIDNDQYFRMMTHFMLDGSLSAEMVERLNASERRIFDKFDALFRKMNMPEPVRPLSHAFFAALNGVLITFRNYPGRSVKTVHQHMHHIAQVIVSKFCAASIK
ncbi:MAG: TetR/AcrR family transcriptional regulator [Deltaproteobacteria bacterium HGW-Deltaproteobacteria-13]|jgi:AcrR family transcriptional regulator|nr:MAG: TetR/AcrR family transcriptional regulator [Deltaproteobacteria bacterium HGW-Deltaproteobacteria-13]